MICVVCISQLFNFDSALGLGAVGYLYNCGVHDFSTADVFSCLSTELWAQTGGLAPELYFSAVAVAAGPFSCSAACRIFWDGS